LATSPLNTSAPSELLPVSPQRVSGLPIHAEPLEDQVDELPEDRFVAPTCGGKASSGALPGVNQLPNQGELEVQDGTPATVWCLIVCPPSNSIYVGLEV